MLNYAAQDTGNCKRPDYPPEGSRIFRQRYSRFLRSDKEGSPQTCGRRRCPEQVLDWRRAKEPSHGQDEADDISNDDEENVRQHHRRAQAQLVQPIGIGEAQEVTLRGLQDGYVTLGAAPDSG
jgi:hypothetical protein